MYAGTRKLSIGAGIALAALVYDARFALAQLVQSDLEAEPGATETTTLVTSSTEVRRAVVGLLALAAVVAILGLLYWLKTGQLARERHAHRYAGRHNGGPAAAGEPLSSADVAQLSTAAPIPPPRVATPEPVRTPIATPVAAGIAQYGTWGSESPAGGFSTASPTGLADPLAVGMVRQREAPVWNPPPATAPAAQPAVPETVAPVVEAKHQDAGVTPQPRQSVADDQLDDPGRWSNLRRDLFG